MIHFSGPDPIGRTEEHWVDPTQIAMMSKFNGGGLRVVLRSGASFYFWYKTPEEQNAEFKLYFDQWVPYVNGI